MSGLSLIDIDIISNFQENLAKHYVNDYTNDCYHRLTLIL